MSIKMTYPIKIVVVDGSPTGSGKTRIALEAVGSGAGDAGAAVEAVGLAEPDGLGRALGELEEAHAVVLGAPVYRAASASPLKQLLDAIPRDREGVSSLVAKPVAIVHTGASLHHFLSLDGLRNVLAGFFAAYVVPPGLYVPAEAFADGRLLDPYADQAAAQGNALVALVEAVRAASVLQKVRPQA